MTNDKDIPLKRCSTCRKEKFATYQFFEPDARYRSGFRSQCRDCRNRKNAEWRKVNIEYNRTRGRKYHQSRKEEDHRQSKEWREKNREYNLARVKVWHSANLDRHAAKEAARRTRATKAGGSFTVTEWEALKCKYNHACLCCGKREPDIKLTADHVIPIFKGGSSHIENIQPLCGPCNSSKSTKLLDFRLKTLDN